MEKVQATNLRPGMVIDYEGNPCRVLTFTHRTPGKGNAVVQAKLRNIRTGIQTEKRFISTETCDRISVTGRDMNYLYAEADGYVFMDQETYEQLTLPADMLEAEAPWLDENIKVTVQYFGDEPMGIELPRSVEIVVAQTEPGMKGATATGGPKPATLANGVVIKIPQFIEQGELLRVDPVEGKYIERVR